MSDESNSWLLINHLGSIDKGELTAIKPSGDSFLSVSLTASTASGETYTPWFLGLLTDCTDDKNIILFNPESKVVYFSDKMPHDAYPAYSYKDAINNRIWFMNDGDKENGNDELNCAGNGSTVTIFDMGDKNTPPSHIKTLCVGSGHHVTTFVSPTKQFPNHPKVAYVSNLLSGSIHVVSNDQNDTENFLKIIHTISLCEPDKEKQGNEGVPNNAFPHGKQLSPHTGKIYSLNNGYGTVAVINPETHVIEDRIDLKGCSNLLLSPCGKFFIGKGADRKSNESHVLGRLSVVDATDNKVISEVDIPDFYPSTYRFNPEGTKLYVTSAATGKGQQKKNLQFNTLYVYDVSQLPKMDLINTIQVGNADCGRRPIAFNTDQSPKRVFIPNPSDATLSILDAETDTVLDTLKIANEPGKEFNFSFWQTSIFGS